MLRFVLGSCQKSSSQELKRTGAGCQASASRVQISVNGLAVSSPVLPLEVVLMQSRPRYVTRIAFQAFHNDVSVGTMSSNVVS